MAEREIDCVIAAETTAGGAHLRPGSPVFHERCDLVHHVGVECVLQVKPVFGRLPAGIPGLAIDGIDANYLEFAPLDFPGERVDHTALFVLPVAAARSREDDDREPPLS